MKMSAKRGFEVRHQRRQRVLPVRGIDYVIYEWGDPSAPLLVYLHGWADTGSCFQFVADELASDWFIVAPDWRGFGRTASRAEAYWFPDYLADLDAILEAYSGGQAARLVGHSMGANVGSLYAGTMPEKVSAFVNVEGFGLMETDPNQAPHRYREWIESSREEPSWSTYESIDALARRIAKRNPNMGDKRAAFVASEWAKEDGVGAVTLRADPNHKRPNAVLYRRAEAEACWRQMVAKVLLIAGSDSPFAEQFGSVASLPFPNARSVTIDGTGHMIHFEQPGALAREIRKFFADHL